MDVNETISRRYYEYKADYEAAQLAERRGNIEGARKLYRQAAWDLCDMAELESGETRRQRILHARTIMDKAESLGKEQPASNAGRRSGSGTAAGPAKGAAMSAEASGSQDNDNPWISEGIPSTTFDDVVGMEDVKRLIRERVIDQFKYPELYAQYGLQGGTGVLLFGLPGTGKTTIARAIAHEFNAPLYTVLGSDIRSKWVGESEKMISKLFDKARSTPTALIFFDDFDDLGKKRSDDSSSVHDNKIIVELINQMDGFKKNTNTIVVLAATNRPWMIDSALMRPGRFEHHFYVPLANHEARVMLIKMKLGRAPVDPDIDMDQVSDLLAGYNGADIESVAKTAISAALRRAKAMQDRGENGTSPVTYEDFVNAAADHKSSVDPGDIALLRQYAKERGIELPEEL